MQPLKINSLKSHSFNCTNKQKKNIVQNHATASELESTYLMTRSPTDLHLKVPVKNTPQTETCDPFTEDNTGHTV